MSWLQRLTPPGVQKMFDKRDTPENLWVKCPVSGEMVFTKDLEAGLHVTPAGHHMRIGPALRFKYTFDGAGPISPCPRWRAIRSNSAMTSPIPAA